MTHVRRAQNGLGSTFDWTALRNSTCCAFPRLDFLDNVAAKAAAKLSGFLFLPQTTWACWQHSSMLPSSRGQQFPSFPKHSTRCMQAASQHCHMSPLLSGQQSPWIPQH
eukprot:CAMPEP_0204271084 /NCGR_PEP_ID=MMETSP0468-20130131/19259_1 /ASSEMBLY_ACC=CAM_ASM_000383 /TAXON_ID=2969 /ORGANISM="Oxyrrhis marina" /LENGTH=108 /DNA_ID=CAMNT_0051246693 /DNA_START=58 /DNA_END=384 /DNA_ORIENTATION=-